MKYSIPIEGKRDRYLKSIRILGSSVYPFKAFQKRDEDVLVEFIIKYNELIKENTVEIVIKRLFNYDFYKEISDNLSNNGNCISIETIRNVITRLRKFGIFNGKNIERNYLPLFVALENSNSLTINFIDNDK